jgi:hypothetical protein
MTSGQPSPPNSISVWSHTSRFQRSQMILLALLILSFIRNASPCLVRIPNIAPFWWN